MTNWFFDFYIIVFLLLDVVLIIYLQRPKNNKEPSWKISIITLLAIIAWGVIFYGSFLEPRYITIKHESVQLNDNPTSSLNLAVISDFHVGPYKDEKFVNDVVDILIEINPDAILIAGDFVYKKAEDVFGMAPFAKITSTYPTYAVTGNHDYDLPNSIKEPDEQFADHIKTFLQESGIIVLNNESAVISPGLMLIGTEEVWAHKADLQKALQSRPFPPPPTILLSHNPEIVREISPEQQIDLVISAHTHGGQIRLPLIGPVPQLPHSLGRQYDQGWLDYNGIKLFITSGIGESGPRARLFNPPEIVVMEINY